MAINIIGFVGIGVSVLVLLFSILAISLDYWLSGKINDIKYNKGLWESCREQSGNKTCTNLNSNSVSSDLLTNYQAVRAMVMLGILLSAGAIAAGVLVIFVMKSAKMLYFMAAGLDIAAGFFLMIGMAVYVNKIKKVNPSLCLDAAFPLDIIAWIAAWFAGAIYVGAGLKDKK